MGKVVVLVVGDSVLVFTAFLVLCEVLVFCIVVAVCVVFISVVVTGTVVLWEVFFVLGGAVAVGLVAGTVDFVLFEIFLARVVERSSMVVGGGV